MSIGDIIRQRKTLKVLAEEGAPFPLPSGELAASMAELVELGSCAPYHYPCDAGHQVAPLDSPAPWRFYALTAENCRKLLGRIHQQPEPVGKIGNMLAAADGLILTTWLPDPPATQPPAEQPPAGQLFEPTRRNMEHIAAASAAIQNMLLAATQANIQSYWSSGGAALRSDLVFEWLSIPATQILLGAIFLFPEDTRSAATKPGANRGRQGSPDRWLHWVQLD